MILKKNWALPPVPSTGPSVPERTLRACMSGAVRRFTVFSDTEKGTKEGEMREIPLDDSRT